MPMSFDDPGAGEEAVSANTAWGGGVRLALAAPEADAKPEADALGRVPVAGGTRTGWRVLVPC